MTINEELVERIGLVADRIDNLLAARKTMPIHLRDHCEPEIMADLRNELRAVVVEISGENPWD